MTNNIIPRAPAEDPDEGSAGESASPPTDQAGLTAARRSAHLELAAALLNPASPEEGESLWNEFAHSLLDFAFPRLMALSRTGRVFKERGLRQFEGETPPKHWTYDDRAEIAHVAIGLAVLHFRDKALEAWNPDESDLYSWFVTNCKMLYADAYNNWVRGSQVSESIGRGQNYYRRVFIDDEEEGERATLHSRLPAPEERVVQLARIDEVMAPTPFPDDVPYRQTHLYRAAGYTAKEACSFTGMTRDHHNKLTKKHQGLLQGDDGPEDQLLPPATDDPNPDEANPPGEPPDTDVA